MFEPRDALLVVLGGLFGWILGRLPDRWVYVIAGMAVLVAVLVLSRAA
jgi:hypothetical protein